MGKMRGGELYRRLLISCEKIPENEFDVEFSIKVFAEFK